MVTVPTGAPIAAASTTTTTHLPARPKLENRSLARPATGGLCEEGSCGAMGESPRWSYCLGQDQSRVALCSDHRLLGEEGRAAGPRGT